MNVTVGVLLKDFRSCLFSPSSVKNLSQKSTRQIRTQPRSSKTNLTQRDEFHPRNVIQSSSPSPEHDKVLKPLLFTVGVCGASYVGATIWQYEELRTVKSDFFNRQRRELQSWYQGHKRAEWREELNRWWKNVPEHERVFYPLLFVNGLVFTAWRVKRWHAGMTKWFCSNPANRAVCWPMFLSTFSHYSVLHLAANMFVLHSFSGPAVHSLGKEQFLGVYIAGGVFSSFVSHLHKLVTRQPVLSLGASGAILSIFAFTCCQMPNSRLQLIFLPGLDFSAQTALVGAMALDVAGLIFRWKLFDHAAHLGGAVLGLFWYKYGAELWGKRGPIIQWWHSVREKNV